jgi:hypothetical protein
MQTALCYLEAVHSKVPEILRDEKLGVRPYFMPESAILPATEAVSRPLRPRMAIALFKYLGQS